MRRLFFILLLVLMPLQFSVAALKAYCQHEAGGMTHLGHHEHQHFDVADNDDEPGTPPALGHLDCGHCHAHCVALATAVAPEAPAIPKAELREGAAAPLAVRALAPPERPQWPGLA
ncbi:hypothetical protein [Pseudacidovorax intermedius]|nr:hypothetical protein [Pseudacidovorax intermedius]